MANSLTQKTGLQQDATHQTITRMKTFNTKDYSDFLEGDSTPDPKESYAATDRSTTPKNPKATIPPLNKFPYHSQRSATNLVAKSQTNLRDKHAHTPRLVTPVVKLNMQ